MKRSFLCLLLILPVCIPFSFAEFDEDLAAKDSGKDSGELVSLSNFRSSSQIDDLSRRIKDLEREERSQNERIRNLERSVSELNRHTY